MKLSYRPELDGLRAITAFAVVLHHSGAPLLAGGGQRGVDVFFVLSGYLITSILIERPAPVTSFWARRFVRLMPALALMVAAYVAIEPWLIPGELRHRWRDAGMTLAYLLDFEMAFHGHRSALGSMWSLGVEEQFYLLWPFVVTWLGRTRRPTQWLLAGWAAFTLLRMAMIATLPTIDPAYNLPAPHASGLLLGAALVFLPAGRAGWIGLVAIGLLFLLPVGPFLSIGITLVELATAAVLLHLKTPGTRLAKLLSVSPLPTLGVLSYGVYLWHGLFTHALKTPWWITAPVAALGATAMAALSYLTIERWAKTALLRNTATRPVVARTA